MKIIIFSSVNMWSNDNPFLNKIPNFEKLINYGFKKCENSYDFSSNISNTMFRLLITVTENVEITFKVIDNNTDDEYTLINNINAVGSA